MRPSCAASETSARATADVRPVIFRMSPGRAPIRSRSAGESRAIACAMSSTRASATRRVMLAAADEIAGSVIFLMWRGPTPATCHRSLSLAALIRCDCLLGPRSRLEPALELLCEAVEKSGQLRLLRVIGIVRGDGDGGGGVAEIGQRDRAEVGVLDRPPVALHRRHGHAH